MVRATFFNSRKFNFAYSGYLAVDCCGRSEGLVFLLKDDVKLRFAVSQIHLFMVVFG